MDSKHSSTRAGDPLPHGKTPFPSGLLSLNIFYQQKKLFSHGNSNCRDIEVTVIYPCTLSTSSLQTPSEISDTETNEEGPLPAMHLNNMNADQERAADLSLTRTTSRAVPTLEAEIFRFLDLPLELRLKICGYLLPARTHTIVTQIPYNGYFYNTATIPAHSAQSFYPFGRTPPSSGNLTTYKIISSNFRSSFPAPSIYPEIFRVCKQVHDEAEPVLYANNNTVFDFGMHSDALMAFMGDRSHVARACVRNVKIAKEIPNLQTNNGEKIVVRGVDEKWAVLCDFLKREMPGLRALDLTVWGASGSSASLPSVPAVQGGEDAEAEMKLKKEKEKKWREWDWTKQLLEMEALKSTKVTWWGFQSSKGEDGVAVGFDSWLAGRMVGDSLVRDRMVREGVVVEGFVVLPGKAA
ncbi:hypothetical protein G7Y89_g7779 [Cudoniella acicularis]|uniref:2EXR domain-containing protein n=1 Tax=Cudoniella acicularis TaxID=354080 RepID=A0A8H4RK53_9HELO|nr:hypothetical protein G7Y89_g7779 [Cudoniella acicularis]